MAVAWPSGSAHLVLQAAGAGEDTLQGLHHDVMAQVRQHTSHKRTFFYLEQLILRHNIDQLCINVKEMHEARLCDCCCQPCRFSKPLRTSSLSWPVMLAMLLCEAPCLELLFCKFESNQ